MTPTRDGLRDDDPETRSAARFALIAGLVGVALLIVAAVVANGCDGAVADSVACGRPQRVVLGLAAPVILFCCGARAFLRTYRLWQQRRRWWAWQGAGWFLMLLMLLVLTMGLPAIAGFGT